MFVSTETRQTDENVTLNIAETHNHYKLYPIYHTPYSTFINEKEALFKEKKHLTIIDCVKTSILTFCCIILTIVLISASIYLYMLASETAINIEGECIVTDKTVSKHCVGGESCSCCSYDTTYYYQFKVYNITICNENANSQRTFRETQNSDSFKYEVNEIVPCYTNHDCSNVAAEEGKDIGLMIPAVFLDIIALFPIVMTICFSYMIWNICGCGHDGRSMCCCNYYKILDNLWKPAHRYDRKEYDEFMNGKDNLRYNRNVWNGFNEKHKVNYFLNFYTREYQLNLYETIGHILVEYIKKSKIPSFSNKNKVNKSSQKQMSNREKYLQKSYINRYDL